MDKITHARLQVALFDFHTMNTDSQWARVVVDERNIITLEYGPIHSDGSEECATGKKLYVWTIGKGVEILHSIAKS